MPVPSGILDPVSPLYPHFSRRELRCKCCGRQAKIANLRRIAYVLEAIRERVGAAIVVHSCYRCPKHNVAVGGAKHSLHLEGLAADISSKHVTPVEMQEIVSQLRREMRAKLDPNAIGGIGRYAGFTHVDVGPPRDWSS